MPGAAVMQSFEERLTAHIGTMSEAEQRIARFFGANRADVLVASAAELATRAGTSDATIIRAAKALGFSGLDDMRRSLAAELRGSLTPAARLTRTLGKVGRDPASAFTTMLDIHLESLESLRRTISPKDFETAVSRIIAAKRVQIFGLGPSSAIANYFAIQLGRFGLEASALIHTGLLFADDLQKLRRNDLVMILAYGQVYPELAALLDEGPRRGAQTILLTDTLAAKLRPRVDMVLQVPRGRADMLSTHTATLGLLEALLVGIAARRPGETLANLEQLNDMRRKLTRKAMRLPTAEGR
jgi:DNA-binding MurR/RpiR family transcriptional regulator